MKYTLANITTCLRRPDENTEELRNIDAELFWGVDQDDFGVVTA